MNQPALAHPTLTVAYTDGACKNNPGRGGWGLYLIEPSGAERKLCGGDVNTTNNRMELMATIEALKNTQGGLQIWTDSSYVKNGITTWIHGWKKKGWKTAAGKPVKNQDLWMELDQLRQGREVDWHWVKGHSGHLGNEMADALANAGVPS